LMSGLWLPERLRGWIIYFAFRTVRQIRTEILVVSRTDPIGYRDLR